MSWFYKSRWIAESLRDDLEFSPVTVVTGARQTGKSTLLRHEEPFRDWRHIDLDELDALDLAHRRPEELLSVADNLIIDEVQRAPSLLLAVKKAVDENRRRRIILSGSSNLLLGRNVAESLAGRAIYRELLPFSLGEYRQAEFPSWVLGLAQGKLPEVAPEGMGNLDDLLFRGFLPPVTFLKKESQIATWWRGYIQSYLEKDLRDLARIAYLPDFRRMMELIGHRCGQILKQSEVARDAGLSQATAGRYINLLEVSGLLLRLRPYHGNISKRLIKSPKLYFIDPGLVCAVCGYGSKQDVPGPFWGALFESFVLANLLSIASRVGGTLYYFRTQGGKEREVDFILEYRGKLIAVEAKHASRVGFRDIDNLLFFRDLVPGMEAGILLYAGQEVVPLARNIYAVPWQALS